MKDSILRGTAIATVLVAGVASTSHATLLAYEGFDYSTLTTLSGQSGGTGFAENSTWKSDIPLMTNSTATVSSGSLTAPPNYAGTLTGNRASLASGGTTSQIVRALDETAQLDLGDNNILYFSFITKRDAGTQTFRLYDESGTIPSSAYLSAQSTSGGNLSLQGFGTTTTVNSVVTGGATLLWVIKVVARKDDPDQYFVALYDSAAEVPSMEPTSLPYASGTVSHSAIITRIAFTTGSSLQVDEIRIGTTWNDVVPVPEPSALSAGLTALALSMGRRVRRK